MIGLDTNILVRYIVHDDEEQAAQASELMEQLTEPEPGYVTMVVLAELYWVLTRAYQTDRPSVLAVLQRLLETRELVVEQADTVRMALGRAVDGADFADALIGELSRAAGCHYTATFDRNAAKLAGMRLVG